MRVKAIFHKRPALCGGCGKEMPAGRSFYLPRWKGGGAYLCGRCGLDEMKKASRESKNDALSVGDTIDATPE